MLVFCSVELMRQNHLCHILVIHITRISFIDVDYLFNDQVIKALTSDPMTLF